MHREILSVDQVELLPLITRFAQSFYLVGGTALALQYGHRRSIDFDLFTDTDFDTGTIIQTVRAMHPIDRTYLHIPNQLTILVSGVKLTFWKYPYDISHEVKSDFGITLPSPISIGAMKAFALGRRAKWKDYVDLYFIFQHHTLKDLLEHAFHYYPKGEFDEKLFRGQLAYHDDIDYGEAVEFLPGFEISKDDILSSLTKISLT